MKIKLVDGLLDRYGENPLFQLNRFHSGFSPALSGHIDVLEVRSKTHLMVKGDEKNEKAYMYKGIILLSMQNLSNSAVAWLLCPSRISSLYLPIVCKAVQGLLWDTPHNTDTRTTAYLAPVLVPCLLTQHPHTLPLY